VFAFDFPQGGVKKVGMKILCVVLGAVLLTGCAGTQRKGISRYDTYDATVVDQMVGNNIGGKAFQKTILCLNARRESRQVTSVTNVQIATVTNQTVVSSTNQTISLSTNFLFTAMTNLAPQPPVVAPAAAPEGAAPAETNLLVTVSNPPPAMTTNVSLSLANNQSATISPSQIAANNQLVRSYNNQISTTSNNLTFTFMTNLVVTGETNHVVNYITNFSLATSTNISVLPTNMTVRDYYLYTELTPPPDFTAAPGDNLILLIDGTRYTFASAPPTAGFSSRKGYSSTLYRVPPEVLIAIANAEEVKVRLRGTTTTIDRTMNQSSRKNLKKFMLKFFQNPPQPEASPDQMTTASAGVTPVSDSAAPTPNSPLSPP
jgi:hypothetical protein